MSAVAREPLAAAVVAALAGSGRVGDRRRIFSRSCSRVSLPWSTSLVAIFAVALLVTMAPFLDVKAFLQSLKRPICAAADRAVCARGGRNALVGRAVGRAALCGRADRETADAAGAVLSFRTLRARPAGVRRLPGLLRAADGDVLDRRVRSGARAQAGGRSTASSVKNYIDQSQEFALCAVALAYPVITLLRAETGMAGGVAAGDRAELHRQHGVRHRVADGAGHHAGHAGGVRAASSEMANHIVIIGCAAAVSGALAWAASPQLRWTAATFLRDYQLYEEQRYTDVDRPAAGILAEIAAVLRRGAADRPWHRFDAWACSSRPRPAARSAPAAEVIANPHNQTLNVAIQWGAIGIVVLYAMWLVHLLLFRGDGLAAWIGLMVVVAEYLHFAVQFPPVRFPRGMDVRAGRRRRRRHGAEGEIPRRGAGARNSAEP